MQALYRKYRSKSLGEIVGQEHIVSTLQSAIKNGRISHAYLFTGPRGTGKTSIARILAHEINQLPYSTTQHLDIIEIDAASNRRIDDIRDLRDKVHIAPTSAKYKVYIIDEVHMLTGESFNALLKTLEEPPAHVVFILATTEVHKLPATIISRTQRYSFRSAEPTQLKKHLADIAKQERIKIDSEALDLVAQHGGGSFRDSISLLDQLANISGSNIDTKTVEQTLGLAPKTVLKELLQAVINKDRPQAVKLLDSLEQQGTTTGSLVPQLTHAIMALAPKHHSLYTLLDQLIEVPRAYNPQIKLLTTLITATLGEPTTKETKHTPALAQPTKPLLEVTKAPQPKKSAKATAQGPAEPPTTLSKPLGALPNEDWAKVLAKVKETSTPLQIVLGHAQPGFDVTSQTLTLAFKYQLHRKKADDSKAKGIIAEAMLTTLGSTPQIATVIDTAAEAPSLAPPAPTSLDDTAQSVASLMGGGEAVAAA